VFTWQFILLTVVHTAGSEGLSSLDIATSSSLSTLTATEEGEYRKDNVSETHDTDSSDESDDETLVLIVSAGVEITIDTTAAQVGGGVGVSVRVVGRVFGRVVFRRVAGVGSGAGWNILLELFGGLLGTVDTTAFGAFLKSVGDVIRDQFGDLRDLLWINVQGGSDNLSGQTKESLSDLVYTWERIAEEGEEGHRFAGVVIFKVNGTLREESGLVCLDLVEDEFGTVLR